MFVLVGVSRVEEGVTVRCHLSLSSIGRPGPVGLSLPRPRSPKLCSVGNVDIKNDVGNGYWVYIGLRSLEYMGRGVGGKCTYRGPLVRFDSGPVHSVGRVVWGVTYGPRS